MKDFTSRLVKFGMRQIGLHQGLATRSSGATCGSLIPPLRLSVANLAGGCQWKSLIMLFM